MEFLETKHKRKSAIITAIILAVLLFAIFNFGMKYLDPPEEYGIAINLGDSDFGNGKPVENTKTLPPQKAVDKVEEKIEENVIQTPKEIIKDEVITDDTAKEVPVIEKKKEEKKEPIKEIIKKRKMH